MNSKKQLIAKILDTVYRDEKVTKEDREFLEMLIPSHLEQMYDEWKRENDKVKKNIK